MMNKETESTTFASGADGLLAILHDKVIRIADLFSSKRLSHPPDQVGERLRPSPHRRSLYSYLARLKRQGLLDRAANPRRGRLSYRLTNRGLARIAYLKSRDR